MSRCSTYSHKNRDRSDKDEKNPIEMSGWYIERDNYPKECLNMINGKKYSLGRVPTSDIVCTDMRVSKKHCEIYISKDLNRCYIMDFSGNGTYVNSKKLNKFGCYELCSGDRIGLAIPPGHTILGLEPKNCFSFRILKIHDLEKALDKDDSVVSETPVDKLNVTKSTKSWMKINVKSPRVKKKDRSTNISSVKKAEIKEKLKYIALKEKNLKSKTPQEKDKKTPFVAKVTLKNRGDFLLQSASKTSAKKKL